MNKINTFEQHKELHSFKENIKTELSTISCAIFDFDGTIYPNMFLFDLAKNIFISHNDINKLNRLNLIAKNYKNGEFKKSYLDFIKLLEGEDKKEFVDVSKSLIKLSYKYAKLTVRKLKTVYNINSYLISITSDFVADLAGDYFDFDNVFSIRYLTKDINNGQKFIGKTTDIIDSPQMMKTRLFKKLSLDENIKFIYFFDSVDDLSIATNASFKIGIKPDKVLSETRLDLVLDNGNDPWKYFYKLI